MSKLKEIVEQIYAADDNVFLLMEEVFNGDSPKIDLNLDYVSVPREQRQYIKYKYCSRPKFNGPRDTKHYVIQSTRINIRVLYAFLLSELVRSIHISNFGDNPKGYISKSDIIKIPFKQVILNHKVAS